MLELAYPNKIELEKKFQEIAFVDKYKYYWNNSYISHEIDLSKDSWSSLDFVSKKDGVIIGYIGANIDRTAGFVSGLRVINFGEKSIEFSKDFHKFLSDLFLKYSFHKINFSVVIGNPAEAMYDRLISKYGGTVAGYYVNDTMLWDRKLYDVKSYEIHKEEFLRRTNAPT